MSELHVVIGAAGGLGSAIVRQLAATGQRVRAVVRNPGRVPAQLPGQAPGDVEVFQADALDAEAVRRACQGAAVVYHCVNVPYHRWPQTMPTATANVLAGAMSAQARLVFPGNVYGYGPLQYLPADEDHPRAATSRKGRLRNTLEERLMAAHRAGECPVVIARMPDYFGPGVTNALFAPLFTAPARGRRAYWPGRLDMPHDLVYSADAAAACILLGATPAAYGQTWHVPGAGPLTGREFIGLIASAAGRRAKPAAMGRMLLGLAGLFVPDAREMLELLYQFEAPLILDGRKFATAFPDFCFTPHADAVAATLAWFEGQRSEHSR